MSGGRPPGRRLTVGRLILLCLLAGVVLGLLERTEGLIKPLSPPESLALIVAALALQALIVRIAHGH